MSVQNDPFADGSWTPPTETASAVAAPESNAQNDPFADGSWEPPDPGPQPAAPTQIPQAVQPAAQQQVTIPPILQSHPAYQPAPATPGTPGTPGTTTTATLERPAPTSYPIPGQPAQPQPSAGMAFISPTIPQDLQNLTGLPPEKYLQSLMDGYRRANPDLRDPAYLKRVESIAPAMMEVDPRDVDRLAASLGMNKVEAAIRLKQFQAKGGPDQDDFLETTAKIDAYRTASSILNSRVKKDTIAPAKAFVSAAIEKTIEKEEGIERQRAQEQLGGISDQYGIYFDVADQSLNQLVPEHKDKSKSERLALAAEKYGVQPQAIVDLIEQQRSALDNAPAPQRAEQEEVGEAEKIGWGESAFRGARRFAVDVAAAGANAFGAPEVANLYEAIKEEEALRPSEAAQADNWRDFFTGKADYANLPDKLGDLAGSQAPMMLSGAGAGRGVFMAGKALGLSNKASTIAAFGASSSAMTPVEFQNQYNEAYNSWRLQGVDEADARSAALIESGLYSGVAAALEAAPIAKFIPQGKLKPIMDSGPFKNALKRASITVRQAGEEFTTEGAQSLASQLAGVIAGRAEMDDLDGWQVLEESIAGAIIGGMTGTAATPATEKRPAQAEVPAVPAVSEAVIGDAPSATLQEVQDSVARFTDDARAQAQQAGVDGSEGIQYEAVEAQTPADQSMQQLAARAGVKLGFFKQTGRTPFVADGTFDGDMVLVEQGKTALAGMGIASHEISHVLQETNPKAWQEFYDELAEQAPDLLRKSLDLYKEAAGGQVQLDKGAEASEAAAFLFNLLTQEGSKVNLFSDVGRERLVEIAKVGKPGFVQTVKDIVNRALELIGIGEKGSTQADAAGRKRNAEFATALRVTRDMLDRVATDRGLEPGVWQAGTGPIAHPPKQDKAPEESTARQPVSEVAPDDQEAKAVIDTPPATPTAEGKHPWEMSISEYRGMAEDAAKKWEALLESGGAIPTEANKKTLARWRSAAADPKPSYIKLVQNSTKFIKPSVEVEIHPDAQPYSKRPKPESTQSAVPPVNASPSPQHEREAEDQDSPPSPLKKKKTRKKKPAQKPKTPPPKGAITDFGEKLGGARKDMVATIEQEMSDDDIASKTLAKVWPKSEVDAIEDTELAAFAFALRNEIPSKPRKSHRLKQWVETVKQAQEFMRLVREKGVNGVLKLARDPKYRLDDWASKVELLQQIDRKEWGRIGNVRFRPDAYRYENQTRVSTPIYSVEVDKHRAVADSREGVLEKVKAHLGDEQASGKKSRMQFEVRGRSGQVNINKKGDPLKRSLKSFPNAKEAFDFRQNNHDALVAAWESLKERENVKEADTRRDTNRPRVGADHRKARDATPEMFMEAFGFRGVEFGNWVAQGKNKKERQGMLNASYDALMDLADLLDIPPLAISLNGTLGLGLGSRGHGWASAHFEPGNIVINLTKTRGAGSLAHEWFHGLDNYFQRMRGPGVVGVEGTFITKQPEPHYKGPGGQTLSVKRFDELKKLSRLRKPEGWKRVEGVRPEVEETFARLVEALNKSPMSKRAKLIDKGQSRGYWSRVIERAARSFENYIIAKMQEKGYENDYLANVQQIEEFSRDPERYPYLLESELPPISDAFDGVFSSIRSEPSTSTSGKPSIRLFSVKMDDPDLNMSLLLDDAGDFPTDWYKPDGKPPLDQALDKLKQVFGVRTGEAAKKMSSLAEEIARKVKARQGEGAVDPVSLSKTDGGVVETPPARDEPDAGPTKTPATPKRQPDAPKKKVEPNDPNTFSARKEQVDHDREAWGKEGLQSTERRSWGDAMDQATQRGLSGKALQKASAIMASPRALSDIETAGMVQKGMELKNEHKRLAEEIANTTDPAEIAFTKAEYDRVEQEFDLLTEAIRLSGSEKGRALASQKLTINQDLDLVSVVNRAKAAKGTSLTAKQRAKLEEMVEKHEAHLKKIADLQKQVAELQAGRGMKRGGRRRYGRMDTGELNADLEARVGRVTELLKAGCD